jgi:hypothetical protein
LKKTLIKGQLKICFDRHYVEGHNFSFLKKKLEYTDYFGMFVLHNINYKYKPKNLSKYLIIIYVNK